MIPTDFNSLKEYVSSWDVGNILRWSNEYFRYDPELRMYDDHGARIAHSLDDTFKLVDIKVNPELRVSFVVIKSDQPMFSMDTYSWSYGKHEGKPYPKPFPFVSISSIVEISL